MSRRQTPNPAPKQTPVAEQKPEARPHPTEQAPPATPRESAQHVEHERAANQRSVPPDSIQHSIREPERSQAGPPAFSMPESLSRIWNSIVDSVHERTQHFENPLRNISALNPSTQRYLIDPKEVQTGILVKQKGEWFRIDIAPIGWLSRSRNPGMGFLQPEAAVAFSLMNEKFKTEYNDDFPVHQAWRSHTTQTRLKHGRHTDAVTRQRAALPGNSKHEVGLSIDVDRHWHGGAALTWIREHGSQYGFINDVSSRIRAIDPFHFTYHGERADAALRERIQKETDKIMQAVERDQP